MRANSVSVVHPPPSPGSETARISCARSRLPSSFQTSRSPDPVFYRSILAHLSFALEPVNRQPKSDNFLDLVYDEIARRHPEADVIVPPRSTAILSESGTTQRDAHLRTIKKHGRIGWQRRSGYCRRSLVETAMFRYKTIIGRRLHARTLPNQKTEAKIGCGVLNRMTSFGMPISVRIK